METYEKTEPQKTTAHGVKPMTQQVAQAERRAGQAAEVELPSTWQVNGEASTSMRNQCLKAPRFESAKLVWPFVVLGDASRLMP